MKKRIAIIGAGISGLIFANFLKQNSSYDFIIYEKNPYINLDEGYGIQLSPNSISILNKIDFKNFKIDNKFNPKKIDFYLLKNNNKICDLDITQFNYAEVSYTTLKRSLFIEFFKEKLLTNSIQFNKKIKKINCSNSKINITFNDGFSNMFDYLIVSDGVFSPTKSILLNENIQPKYSGSIAIRTLVKRDDLQFLNGNNISLFLGSNIHLVTYALNIKNEFNLIATIRKNLDKESLNDQSYFKSKDNVQKFINESLILRNNGLKNFFNKIKDVKCFPTFISDKIRKSNHKNIFFLGDAFYAPLPAFAQGASQAIEAAYELFNILSENSETSFNKYFINRIKRVKLIDSRSRLNHFIFHISNPILVALRNIILKIIVNKKNFLNKYLGKIYLKK